VPAPLAAENPESSPLPDEDRATGGAWVGTLLFLIVMAAGVALAGLTLVPYEMLVQ
jgi:hypothetical protein